MPLKLPEVKLSRKDKIIIGISITICVLVLISIGVWLSARSMFSENPRFKVMYVQVESTAGERGWWQNKSDAVVYELAKSTSKRDPSVHIRRGETNLFRLDLKLIREKLEGEPKPYLYLGPEEIPVRGVPGIASARVERVLPDTLKVTISERIPRAVLARRGNSQLIDSDAVVISSERSMGIERSLPVIFGFSRRIPDYGDTFEELKPALDFIMLCRTEYPSLRVATVNSPTGQNWLESTIFYRNDVSDSYRIRISRNGIRNGLNRVMTAIADIKRGNISKHAIDARYEGRDVIKDNF